MDTTPTRRELLGATARLGGGLVAASTVGMTAFADAAGAAVPAKFPKSPDAALRRLMAGNARFVDGEARNPRRSTRRRVRVAESQKPFAAVLTCADSRVPPELVLDQGIGDLFVVRIAGNTGVDPLVVGSLEYSVEVLGSILVFVLGHSNCGAVKAAIDVATKGATLPGDLPAVVAPIIPAVDAVKDRPKDELLEAATEENIRLTMEALSAVALLRDRVADGSLLISGGEYELASGKVDLVP
ncbi:MAG TPA: carbonic anhydrase [Acidimicrobiia bacterium]